MKLSSVENLIYISNGIKCSGGVLLGIFPSFLKVKQNSVMIKKCYTEWVAKLGWMGGLVGRNEWLSLEMGWRSWEGWLP